MTKIACPCCGHRTLDAEPLCPVCAFEARPVHPGELDEAQRHVASCGAADPSLIDFARAPGPDETVPDWFFTERDGPRVLVERLEAAFAGVTLDGGVSLREAEKIDDYELPARTNDDPAPTGFEDFGPWTELPDSELEAHGWGNFSFQDGRGLRYHLPAWLRYALRHPMGPLAVESAEFALTSGFHDAQLLPLLTAAQKRVFAQYLSWQHAGDAHTLRSLDRLWSAFLPEEERRYWAHRDGRPITG